MEVSINILHSTNDETNESDSLPIMKTSSYYDTNNFKSLVNTKINSFGIFITSYQPLYKNCTYLTMTSALYVFKKVG